MLSARYLAGCSDDIVKLYAQLERDILVDMVKRLKKLGKPDNDIIYQAKIYKEIGGLQEDVLKVISRYSKESQKMIVDLFNQAINKAITTDVKKMVAGRQMTENQEQIINATVQKLSSATIINSNKKTKEDFASGQAIKVFSGIQRLTMTIADTSSSQFVQVANRSYMQVVSGAFDYDTAFKMAVDSLAKQGISTVNYTDSYESDYSNPNRVTDHVTRSIESAVRTNILSGINQTVQTITLNNCEELDTDLVEVSAHMGARDVDVNGRPWANHSELQGKVYCLTGEREYVNRNGERKIAPDFYKTCGIGQPDGIGGINCRHSFYPYFEGSSELYTDNQLDEMNDQFMFYEGHKMTQYEAEQNLRSMERNIRKWKRQADMEKAGNIDNLSSLAKVNAWQSKIEDYCKQTGLKRDYAREYTGKVKQ